MSYPTEHVPASTWTGDDVALLFASLLAAIVVLFGFSLWLKRTKRRQDEIDRLKREAEYDRLQGEIEAKLRTPDGKAACVVCQSGRATHPWPIIERSWLDRLTFLKDLYALTPRYAVAQGWGSEYENLLCAACNRVITSKWNEVLAGKRTAVQRLFSEIESELAQLQAGAMLRWARAEHARSRSALNVVLGIIEQSAANSEPPRQLVEAVQHDRPISMPAMSTQKGSDDVAIDSDSHGSPSARPAGDS